MWTLSSCLPLLLLPFIPSRTHGVTIFPFHVHLVGKGAGERTGGAVGQERRPLLPLPGISTAPRSSSTCNRETSLFKKR
ncbi:hypothetical protein B0F90DRAFT_1707647 [Multifurca ochricompacta]|uniref:Secreted protein n=1 Tax=Multifurca ochricompacta TaxID=376703 RepID=A0AAD4M7S7_9AGAM|nr:hypothetical protein B0F90DRAFT_1707647 [Multifurca ochricompacta]